MSARSTAAAPATIAGFALAVLVGCSSLTTPPASSPTPVETGAAAAGAESQTLTEALGCTPSLMADAPGFSAPTAQAAVDRLLQDQQNADPNAIWTVKPFRTAGQRQTWLLFRDGVGVGTVVVGPDSKSAQAHYVALTERLCPVEGFTSP